ncbi:Leucine-rich_repeat domain superfamily [Hexamita inflata]|uniref:Leucine-rich repeat domain superfamily n=1 Tax=Hexamita inflata TaxID=28002 RepID=A0AA86PSD3_9EUKA|nr:Leucine-rich repeat domain superfamily [Hexamita inflata]
MQLNDSLTDSETSQMDIQNSSVSDSTEHITEQYVIVELRNQIKDNILEIIGNDDLYNIEFINDFEIEELVIVDCFNSVPKLKNPRIKKLEFQFCGIYCLNELQLPNLEVFYLYEEQSICDGNILSILGQHKKLKELVLGCDINLDLKLIKELQLTKLELSYCEVNKF